MSRADLIHTNIFVSWLRMNMMCHQILLFTFKVIKEDIFLNPIHEAFGEIQLCFKM